MLKWVAKKLRHLWAQCFARALSSAAFHNDVAHWTELQMLPKATLCAPLRAGKQHQAQRVAFTRQRLHRWRDGERGAVWQDIPSYTQARKRSHVTPEMDKAMRQQRCAELCGDGAISQACKTLYSPELLDPSTVLDEMRAKHPAATRPPDLAQLGQVNAGLAPTMDAEAVKGAINTFSQHSGAGPSGLRPSQSLSPAHSDQVLEHLAHVINLITWGQAHHDIAAWVYGASLMALPKKDGSARPIAVGEALLLFPPLRAPPSPPPPSLLPGSGSGAAWFGFLYVFTCFVHLWPGCPGVRR